jgi:hypothetical protein
MMSFSRGRALAVSAAFALCITAPVSTKAACVVMGAGSTSSNHLLAAPDLQSVMPQEESSDNRNPEDGRWTPRIVGMWIIDITFENGATDHAIEQFSSDGTEAIESTAFPPASENRCFGIWRTRNGRTYMLTHIGWDFFTDTGAFKGTARLILRLTLHRDGNSFTGELIEDEVDPSGNIILQPVKGTVTGRRFKHATSLGDIMY